MIAQNLKTVWEQIRTAARKSGRDEGDVELVAVSKTVSDDKILEAIAAGQRVFGENRVQEALGKFERIRSPGITWHLIGHLQKNKVKYILEPFSLVHSVDDLELAETIDRAAQKRGIVMPVLLQVNVSGEASKFGMPSERLETVLVETSRLQGIRVEGLMTIPPNDPVPENSRKFFARLRELRDKMNRLAIDGVELRHLSMGMSNDFPVAIEEGATLVRVGSAIFGTRPAP